MTEPKIIFVPGMPYVLDEDGNRLPDLDRIRASKFPTPYTASQFGGRPTVACAPDSSETSQEFKDECDINIIMRRYAATGALPALNMQARYGDFSEVPDYQDALQTVLQAQEDFAQLPAALRDRFNHDPGRLLAFLQDANNRDEAIKLGLITSPPVPTTASPAATPPQNDSTKT